jgi:PhzF family phenazine biosynthesis protein
MRIDVQIVNAFIDGENGGNPAGVVVNANGMTDAQKLATAKAVGLSETAFVSASQTATFKLEQRAPTYRHISHGSEMMLRILSSLGIDAQQTAHPLTPCVVSIGNSFLLIPLASQSVVEALQPRQQAIEAISEELDLIGYYAFSRTTRQAGRAAGARMFAPRFGIAEEAGTGMAAGPLACYLHDVMHVKDNPLLIEQGWLMPTPSPSLIQVDLSLQDGHITRLMAGGRAKVMWLQTVEV